MLTEAAMLTEEIATRAMQPTTAQRIRRIIAWGLVALVLLTIVVVVGLSLWTLFGDEPQWLDELTDPIAHKWAEFNE